MKPKKGRGNKDKNKQNENSELVYGHCGCSRGGCTLGRPKFNDIKVG